MSGLGPMTPQSVEGEMPSRDQIYFAWTGCPQNLMDVPGSGPYPYDENSDYIEARCLAFASPSYDYM